MGWFEILNHQLRNGSFGLAIVVKRSVWREKMLFLNFMLCHRASIYSGLSTTILYDSDEKNIVGRNETNTVNLV